MLRTGYVDRPLTSSPLSRELVYLLPGTRYLFIAEQGRVYSNSVPGIIVAEPPRKNHILQSIAILQHVSDTSKHAIDISGPSPMRGRRTAKNFVAANRPEGRRLSWGLLRPGRSRGLSPLRLHS